MGSKPTLGHMPDIYSLLSDHELVSEYENEIIPRLELTGQEIKPKSSELEQLRRENTNLRDQLVKLAMLLTERAQ
jgi:cell shape-determining protein MreC